MKTLRPILRALPGLCGLVMAMALYAAEPAPDAPPPQEEPSAAPPAQTAPEAGPAPPGQGAEPDDVGAPGMDAAPTPPDEPLPTPSDREPAESDRPTAAPAQPVPPPASSSTTAPDSPTRANPPASPATDAAWASSTTPSEPITPVKPGEKGLRLNFRGVPLELVLNYLSEAAGFIIVLETDVRGKVDVWSNQPLDQDEALTLLSTVLDKNGYAALRNGRMLTIVSRDDAKKRDIPVISGSDPEQIPKKDEIVTQILPVRFINAAQLATDLAPLIPSSATVTANQGGNALLITDTQIHIRRIAEIIKALDTSIASTYVIRVFALQYADAKSLASVIKDLFQSQDTSSSRSGDSRAQQFFNRFSGGPGGMQGGPGGQGGTGSGSGASGGRAGATRVVAVADERSNAVVVSAPEDVMQSVEDLVKAVDTEIEDVTEVRVFHLKSADPQEMADLLSSLFPDTSNTQNSRSQMRFAGGRGGGMGGFGMMGGSSSTATSSERLLKQTRVVAVADPRTQSVVVSASRTLMEQVAQMITQLDSDPAKKQKVFVYDVENTDPQAVQEVLQSLFPEQNNSNSSMRRNSTTQRQNSNQLNNRQTQTRNSSSRSSSSTAAPALAAPVAADEECARSGWGPEKERQTMRNAWKPVTVLLLSLGLWATGSAWGQGFGGGGMTSSRSRSTTTYPSSTEMGGASVTYDQETRKLIVITDEATAQNISQVVTNLNRPAPQVLINVVFLEVTHRKGSDLGVSGVYRREIDSETTANFLQQFLGVSGLNSGSGIFNIVGSNYEAMLRAIAEAGKLEVLSRPTVLARNNQEAYINVGQSVPLITGVNYDSFGNQRNAIEYRDLGVILRVTPFVTSEGLVEMIVAPEISNLSDKYVAITTGTNSVGSPIINRRSADTVVVTPDGQTVVIGGLMQTSKSQTQSKVPLLGDIPLLGWAFRRTVSSDEKTELLIFLTPHIVKTPVELAGLTRDARKDAQVVPKAFTEEELNRFIDGVPVKDTTPPAKKKKKK